MNYPENLDRVELLKAAYRQMTQLRERLAAAEDRASEPVAIVGIGCRMPGGAEDPEAFWQMLSDGVDGTSEIPIDRWDVDAFYDPDPEAPNKMYVRRGGFINNYRGFDPLFFHVSPLEAASMDPQQRILMEVTWEALENAGWAPDRLAGSHTGVFIGTSGSDFSFMALGAMQQNAARAHMATGISPSITAGHLSYFLGLRGPCMAVDTACSSALTAVHVACASLRKGESTAAIVGAVSLVIAPVGNILVCKARMLAPDGHCKTFDASADGYARSEGCGVLILKLLSQAQADGDRILGVIRGSACNQDGRTNGITAPSGNAQREVVQAALDAAGVAPSEIEYIETHGTGTSLGDPIEVQALGEVFGPGRAPESQIVLGAVKSNVGHLECAAGMAAIIKAALVLQKGEIPPNLHFTHPNPHIPWDRLPFKVPTARTPWPSNGAPRKAGVSAFGFSGTNVHMVLEEPPALLPRPVIPDRGHHLLVLSGQTPQALQDLAARYAGFFEQNPGAELGDVCFTASVGRSHFAYRLALRADTVDAMRAKLLDFITLPDVGPDGGPDGRAGWFTGLAPGRRPGLGLLIGAISLAAGHVFHATSPAFRQAWDACAIIAENLGMASLDAAGPAAGEPRRSNAHAFALAYATAAQWLDWGLAPVVMAGFGAQVFPAAALAGAISLEDAFRLALDPSAVPPIWTEPTIPLVSPLTGAALTAETLADVAKVPGADASGLDRLLQSMAQDGARQFLALGDIGDPLPATKLIVASGKSWEDALAAVGRLYVAGVSVEWAQLEAGCPRRRLALPAYPFQRQDCWFDVTAPKQIDESHSVPLQHPLLGRRIHSAALGNQLVFESTFTTDAPALLKDHRFFSTIVVSMTAMLEMAAAGGQISLGFNPLIEDIVVERPLLVLAGQARVVQTVFEPDNAGSFSFSIMSADAAQLDDQPSWDRHCSGRVRRMTSLALAPMVPDEIMAGFDQTVEPDWFYDTVSRSGVDYGPSFRTLRLIRCDPWGALAKIVLPAGYAENVADYAAHPGMLDAALQAFCLGAAIRAFGVSDEERDAFMPVSIERYALIPPAGGEMWCHATVRPPGFDDPESLTGDLKLYTPAGDAIGELAGVLFKRNSGRKLIREIDEQRLNPWLYKPDWEILASPEPKTAEIGEQRWLLIGTDSELAARLADEMQGLGVATMLVPARAADFDSALRDTTAGGKLDGIVYVAGGAAHQTAAEMANDGTAALLDLVQALLRHGINQLVNFALVTQGFKVPSFADGAALAGSAMWGFGRVVASELPELNCRLYDIDAALNDAQTAARLAAELLDPSAENQIALDRTDRYALRLMRAEGTGAETQRFGFDAVQLEIAARGDLRQLRFVPQPALVPGPNEVLLRILATAMNFRDVLNVLGMYPGDPGDPGVECVGEIVALGEGVEGVAIGDQVLAIPYKGYSTFSNAPMNMVFKRPENLSVAESATLLVAYLTATYALNHLGRMQRGERVLVHAGAGGVGLAAIQLAQRAGAEVFATAGSPAKREYLRQIGVHHVLDSRSIEFVEQIKTITGNEGIDLVLNSLTGAAMEQSLRLLRPGGRFLEIGKTDVYTPEQAAAINPHASHEVIELLAPFQHQAALMQALFDDVRQGLANGELRPLPYKIFGLEETSQAMRYMSAARQIGKIVVIDRSADGYRPIEPSGTYLVTGGLGGLGLACGLWLAREGAKSVVLVSRRCPGPDEEAAIKAIEEAGATIHIGRADVGDRQQLAALLAEVVSPTRPLRGIIHSAGVVDDGAIFSLSRERLAAVMRAKVDGGWNLHELTLAMPLEFFVLFSSGAGLFGNPGQSSYAAANVFLDELARARQNGGLTALSIDWGPWADVGMAARMEGRHARDWQAGGLRSIALEEGLTVLKMLLRMNRHDQVAVLPLDSAALAQSSQGNPFLGRLVSDRVERKASAASLDMDFAARFKGASTEEKLAVLAEIITSMVIDVFGLDSASMLALDQNLTQIGMDSLMAIQLSNRLKTAFSISVPATLAFQRPTVQDISEYVLEKMAASVDASGPEPEGAPEDPSAGSLLANLAELDDSAVESMLAELEKGTGGS